MEQMLPQEEPKTSIAAEGEKKIHVHYNSGCSRQVITDQLQKEKWQEGKAEEKLSSQQFAMDHTYTHNST